MLLSCVQGNGSLLLATTEAEVQQLHARADLLQQQGLKGVVLLSPRELKMHEPALRLPTGSMGLLVGSDAQIVRNLVEVLLQSAVSPTLPWHSAVACVH